jgi:mono/diheme cytochrome c family protein
MQKKRAWPLLTLAAAASAAIAQPTDPDEILRGRQIFAQSCGICHLQPSLGVKTYGPPLNKTAAGGSDEVMRAVIVNGTDRMPAFKYYLKPAEIDAIIAYLRTVPAPAAPSKDTAKGKADAHD